MTYVPYSQETSDHYRLYNPTNGVIADFNDPESQYYVGELVDVQGLQGPEVREAAEDLVQEDGGTHGYFYFGRRPIELSANVVGHDTAAERALRLDRAIRASAALRTDATLSWKPPKRIENLVKNPKAAVDLSNRGGSATAGWVETRATTNLPAGWSTGILVTATATATTASGGLHAPTSTGLLATPVSPGRKMSTGFSAKLLSVTSGSVTSFQVRNYWYKEDGTTSSTGSTTVVSQSNPVIGTDYVLQGIVTVPSDAYYGTVRFIVGQTNPSTFTATYTGLKFGASNTVLPYVDGDMAGYYWQGPANASASGDFIEMFTPVRRGGPVRVTGGWTKELQVPLVSEYATLQSTGLYTATGAGGATVTCENRGSWPAAPILRVTGATATNFTITNTAPNPDLVLRTTGSFSVAAGETLEIDTLNRNAYFTAGARNGQSANRYIDFALTTWPVMAPGDSTFVLSGTGTLVVNWRDTWV